MIDNNIELSIVMPCLNEGETIGLCIEKAKRFFEHNGINGEIIISDNGSDDESVEVATKAGAKITHVKRKGYGFALIEGIKSASGKYIIMGDSDDSYDFSRLEGFVEKLRRGYELVMGCRLPSGGGVIKKGAMPFLHRYIGNPVLSKLGKYFFKVQVNDFHCGLRGMTKNAFDSMQLTAGGMEFASEMIIKAKLLGLKIAEIPIILHPSGRSRHSHLNSLQDGWRHLKLLFLYCPRWLFFYPGLLLMIFGLLGIVIMSFLGKIQIYNVILFINSALVFHLSIISGVQLFFFALIAELLATRMGLTPRSSVLQSLSCRTKVGNFYFLGFLSFLIGLSFLMFQTIMWMQGGFVFNLDIYHDTIKNIIAYISLILIGLQIIFFGFIVDVLN